MSLLAIDPGVVGLGWANFCGGVLRSAGLIEHLLPDGLGQLLGRFRLMGVLGMTVVVEIPQVYPQRLQKGDPNDLISVALVAGVAAAVFLPYCTPRFVKPHAWKGTVPKDIHNRRIEAALDENERKVLLASTKLKSKRHNVTDAVGLGLWKLGRL